MGLYVSDDVIVVNNHLENAIFCYSREAHMKYTINEDAWLLLKYVYSHPNIEKNIIAEKFLLEDDVINEFVELRILSFEKQNDFHNIKEINELNAARIVFEITDNCNLKCKHCFGSYGEHKNNLQFDIFEKIINEAAKLGVYEVTLTGGEPTLHPNIEEILKVLYQKGMIVTVFSNLTNDKITSIMVEKSRYISKVITSIESHNSHIHDEFRGKKGALDKTIHSINILKQTTISIAVNVVVGNHNVDHVLDLIKWLKYFNVEVVVDIVSPEGRAKSISTCYKHIFEQMQKILTDEFQIESKNCGVGKRFVYVCPNGDIVPCSSMKQIVVGNISKNYSLCEGYLDVFNVFKKVDGCNNKEEACHNCNGGCRARAFIETHDLSAADPLYCGIYKYSV